MQDSQNNQPKMLSERAFGLIFATIFFVVALFPVFFNGWNFNGTRTWALIVSGVFALPALIFPVVLKPLNIAWMHFGQFMHKIINPVLMGLVFFVAVLPTGLILKLLGKDPMRRKFDPQAETYWLEREEGSLTKDSFDNQF